jgi:transposase-like protein
MITWLTAAWQQEYDSFRKRDIRPKHFAYIWADGIHFRIRLEDERLCTLVLIGVREDGRKELIAADDGYRESKESWLTVFRDLAARGVEAPLLAIGDGALGFWAALREVWPESQEQGGWVHRTVNVLDKLPKRLQPRAKSQLHEIFKAETKKIAEEEVEKFVTEYEDKYPKAVASLLRDRERMLTFHDFPAATGNRSGARMSSSPRSRPFASDNASRKARAHEPRVSRWPSSCWRWRRNAGEESAAHNSLSRCSKERSSPLARRGPPSSSECQ